MRDRSGRKRVVVSARPALARTSADALTDLFLAHHEQLVSAVRANADPEHAEDAVMVAWMQLVTRPDVAGAPTVTGWLLTVAKREAWRMAARERHAPLEDELVGEPGPDVAARVDARAALRELPVRQARYLVAKHVCGLSYEDIAAADGVTYTAVNRHISRGRKALRELLAA